MGEEELLRARAVSAVRSAVLAHHPDAEVHELPAAGLPIGELAEVLAPSLFGGHRLVVVTGVQECAAALAEALTGYAKDPDPDLTLVIVHFGGKRNEALVKAFRSAGAALDECPKVSSVGDRIGFVRNEVRNAGGRITPDAVTALVEAIGADLRQLSRPRASSSPTSAARSTPMPSRGSITGRRRSAASPSPSACSWATAPGRSRCCAGPWSAASPTC